MIDFALYRALGLAFAIRDDAFEVLALQTGQSKEKSYSREWLWNRDAAPTTAICIRTKMLHV